MEEVKNPHNIITSTGLANGRDVIMFQCSVCKYITTRKEELKGECGGLSPLGFGVGDKAPSKDRFGG